MADAANNFAYVMSRGAQDEDEITSCIGTQIREGEQAFDDQASEAKLRCQNSTFQIDRNTNWAYTYVYERTQRKQLQFSKRAIIDKYEIHHILSIIFHTYQCSAQKMLVL
jgi:hypothetical protein